MSHRNLGVLSRSVIWIILALLPAACGVSGGTPVEELLLRAEELPGEWVSSNEGPQPGQGGAPLGGGPGAIDSTVEFYYHPTGDGRAGAHERILRFRSIQDAEDGYLYLSEVAFRNGPDWTWARPQPPIELPTSVSEGQVKCTLGRYVEACRVVARFEAYVVDFMIELSGLNSQLENITVATEQDIAGIIESIASRDYTTGG